MSITAINIGRLANWRSSMLLMAVQTAVIASTAGGYIPRHFIRIVSPAELTRMRVRVNARTAVTVIVRNGGPAAGL